MKVETCINNSIISAHVVEENATFWEQMNSQIDDHLSTCLDLLNEDKSYDIDTMYRIGEQCRNFYWADEDELLSKLSKFDIHHLDRSGFEGCSDDLSETLSGFLYKRRQYTRSFMDRSKYIRKLIFIL